MSTNGIRVEEFNIYSLGAEAVSYHLKDIHTLALQVTTSNIGVLSLELETELQYGGDEPYLIVLAARGPKEDPEQDRKLTLRPNDWLVVLWDEIHMFRDPEFRSTFSFDGESIQERVEKVGRHIGEPAIPRVGPSSEKTQIVPVTGNLYPEGEKPQGFMPPGSSQAEIDAQLALERVALPALERAEEKQKGPRSEMLHTGVADSEVGN